MTAAMTLGDPAEPVIVRGRDGRRHHGPLTAAAQRALFARLLLDHRPGELVHVWPARREAGGRLVAFRRQPRAYLPAGDHRALLSRAGAWQARGLEVFAGLLPRTRPEPTAAAVGPGDVVWVDVDGDAGALGGFCAERPPHYLAASGGGGRHAAWRLDRRHAPGRLAEANRRLAAAVNGDPAVCHPGASLRMAGTRNRKPGAGWCRILQADLGLAPYRLEDLVAGLPEAGPAAGSSGTPWLAVSRPERLDAVVAIAPPVYFGLLAGVCVPEGGGLVCCPLPGHPDEHPSCMVYPTVERGWRCFSHPGGAGGRIYDLASALAGGPTGRSLRGAAFLAARESVRRALGDQAPAG